MKFRTGTQSAQIQYKSLCNTTKVFSRFISVGFYSVLSFCYKSLKIRDLFFLQGISFLSYQMFLLSYSEQKSNDSISVDPNYLQRVVSYLHYIFAVQTS